MTTMVVSQQIEEKVRGIVASVLNKEDGGAPSCHIDESSFDLDGKIELDHGGCDLDTTVILMEAEREFDIALSDIYHGGLTTHEIIAAIERATAD